MRNCLSKASGVFVVFYIGFLFAILLLLPSRISFTLFRCRGTVSIITSRTHAREVENVNCESFRESEMSQWRKERSQSHERCIAKVVIKQSNRNNYLSTMRWKPERTRREIGCWLNEVVTRPSTDVALRWSFRRENPSWNVSFSDSFKVPVQDSIVFCSQQE